MRPYQLWIAGPWIDLDAVQEVIPPEFVDHTWGRGGFFVEMHIRFAFQDNLRTYRWKPDWKTPEIRIYSDGSIDEGFSDPRELITLTDGVPDTLIKVELNVFRPLMYRWAGIRITGPVVPRGWEPQEVR